MKIGEKIKKLRKAAGLSQTELGEITELPQTTISMIEIGKNKNNIESIGRIAKALGVTLDQLVDD